MKTITDYADEYVGHPQEIDEDLSVYTCRVAYKAGMIKAFELIRHEINVATIEQYKFPILHLLDYMDKMQGRKEVEKSISKAHKIGIVFATKVDVEVYEDKDIWRGSVSIGEEYYETDVYKEKSYAASEILGYLEGLQAQINKEIEMLRKEEEE